MSGIILFHFEQSEVRYVGNGVNHEWVAQDVCNALGIKDTSDALKRLDADEKGAVSVDTLGGQQRMLTVNEPGLYTLVLGSRKPVAKRFKRWLAHEVIPSIRETGNYSIEQAKTKLERQFRPEITAQNRIDALKLLKIGGNDRSFIQRASIQMAKAVCPDIEVPLPTEMFSLPTAKALLNPTDIAKELGWLRSTGNGNPELVNKELHRLGYQEKIAGRWSATQKAIDAKLCDRKPVNTPSRTQKDQLLWSADIVAILQEHSFAK